MLTKRIWASVHPFYEGGEIMGRSVANEDFLRALLKLNPFDEYHFYLASNNQISNLKARLEEEFVGYVFHFELQFNLPQIMQKTRFEVFHLSDWVSGFVPLAVLRNQFSDYIFPITGIIHSLSYARYHGEFLRHLWPGCTKRDAIVVTSRAGNEVMQRGFEMIAQNYGLSSDFMQPGLEQIPLGVAGIPLADEISQWRKEERKAMQLDVNDTMLLYVGRINHTSKKDMLPLLRVLKRAEGLGVDLSCTQLVLAGWMDENDEVTSKLKQFAHALGIKLSVISRPDDAQRNRLYAAADIFVSLVDNLQETFGISLLEAGAFSLPVLASDFDGYRDTIEHDLTGFLAPTIGPRNTGRIDQLAHFWFDNQYHLALGQQTVIEVSKAAEYLAKLVLNPGLREKMGRAACKRVEQKFTWEKIIPQYVEMWEKLATNPVQSDIKGILHPGQLNWAELFKGHFSTQLNDGQCIVRTKAGDALYRGVEMPVIYSGIESMLSLDLLKKLMFMARKPVDVKVLINQLGSDGVEGELIDFVLLWALKHDFLELAEPFDTGEKG